jgi:hypothetical protein
MQRIIIDTNVLISALIQKSYPNFILFHCILENRFEVCISEELLEEYLEVINRPKFSKYPDFLIKAELVISQIESIASKYYPRDRFETIADKADNRLLELAYESNADFLITGNSNDFTMTEFRGTKILSPKEFWDQFSR